MSSIGGYLDKAKMLKRLQRELDIGYQGERLAQIELVKSGEGGEVESIYDAWTAAAGWPEPKDLVAEMDEKIEENLDSNTEPYTIYKFLFRYGSSKIPKNGPFIQKVKNLNYHDSEEQEMVALEGTSGKGLAVTAHRALIQYIGATVGERGEVTRLLKDLLHQANDRADRAEQRQIAFQRATEDLIDRSMERNLALKAAERMEGMKEQFLGMAMGFAPSAIGGFLEYMKKKNLGQGEGSEGHPALPSKNEFLTEQFVLSLKPDEREGIIQGLVATLGDTRALPFLEVMNGMREKIAANDVIRGYTQPPTAQAPPAPSPAEEPPPPAPEAPAPPPPVVIVEPPAAPAKSSRKKKPAPKRSAKKVKGERRKTKGSAAPTKKPSKSKR